MRSEVRGRYYSSYCGVNKISVYRAAWLWLEILRNFYQRELDDRKQRYIPQLPHSNRSDSVKTLLKLSVLFLIDLYVINKRNG